MTTIKAQSAKLPYISFQAVAEELNCSLRHVERMVKQKGLSVRLFGKKPLLRVEDIIEDLEKNKKPVPL